MSEVMTVGGGEARDGHRRKENRVLAMFLMQKSRKLGSGSRKWGGRAARWRACRLAGGRESLPGRFEGGLTMASAEGEEQGGREDSRRRR